MFGFMESEKNTNEVVVKFAYRVGQIVYHRLPVQASRYIFQDKVIPSPPMLILERITQECSGACTQISYKCRLSFSNPQIHHIDPEKLYIFNEIELTDKQEVVYDYK